MHGQVQQAEAKRDRTVADEAAASTIIRASLGTLLVDLPVGEQLPRIC